VFEYRIREAVASDLETIVSLIRELAVYERLEHEMVADPDEMKRHLFGDRPAAEVLIAESTSGAEPTPIGFALFFGSFSTFLGKPGIYLEDVFVREESRGHGVGKALLGRLAGIAVERGCGRLEWSVLDWNEPAITFYRSLGAVGMDGWTVNRLTGDALAQLASQ
jgi:GNAT superfamily N-acetyltransferase